MNNKTSKIKSIKSKVEILEPQDIEPYCEIAELKRKNKDFDDDLIEY